MFKLAIVLGLLAVVSAYSPYYPGYYYPTTYNYYQHVPHFPYGRSASRSRRSTSEETTTEQATGDVARERRDAESDSHLFKKYSYRYGYSPYYYSYHQPYYYGHYRRYRRDADSKADSETGHHYGYSYGHSPYHYKGHHHQGYYQPHHYGYHHRYRRDAGSDSPSILATGPQNLAALPLCFPEIGCININFNVRPMTNTEELLATNELNNEGTAQLCLPEIGCIRLHLNAAETEAEERVTRGADPAQVRLCLDFLPKCITINTQAQLVHETELAAITEPSQLDSKDCVRLCLPVVGCIEVNVNAAMQEIEQATGDVARERRDADANANADADAHKRFFFGYRPYGYRPFGYRPYAYGHYRPGGYYRPFYYRRFRRDANNDVVCVRPTFCINKKTGKRVSGPFGFFG